MVPIDDFLDQPRPLFVVRGFLNADHEELAILLDERQGRGDLLRGLPCPDVDVEQILRAEFHFPFFHHAGDSHGFDLGHILLQQQIDQIHLVEIPKVLVVKPSDALVLVLEDAEESPLPIPGDTE